MKGGHKSGSSNATTMTGLLTDENLKNLDDLQEGEEEYSESSIPLSDIEPTEFRDEPVSVTTSYSKRSLLDSSGNQNGIAMRKKDELLYGSEGDLLWKALVVTLLTMIGTAAGFVYLYGLIQGDVETTAKVSTVAKEGRRSSMWDVHLLNLVLYLFQFQDYANLLEMRAPDQVKEINGGMVTWSVHGSSYATLHSDTWPFHRFSNFEHMTQHMQELVTTPQEDGFKETNHVQWVATAPLVADENRTAWEFYSVEQFPKATRFLTKTSANYSTLQTAPTASLPAHYRIHRYDRATGKLVPEERGTGPYTPLFQMSHSDRSYWNISSQAEETTTNVLYNLNLLSIPAFARAFSLVQHSGEPVLSEPIMLEDNFYASIVLDGQDDGGVAEPYSILVNPIVDGSETEAKVTGALVGLVPYKAFFNAIIPSDAMGMSMVLRPATSCTEGLSPFTFTIEKSEVIFQAQGDNHDASYNFHEKELAWEPFAKHRHPHGEDDLIDAQSLLLDYYYSVEGDKSEIYCPYELYVYPTDQFYNTLRSNGPRLFAAFLVGIFLFVYFILNLYGYIIKQKDLLAFTSAQRSAAIVDMFFPAEVKDRLLEEQGDDEGDGPPGEGQTFNAEGANQRLAPTPGFDPARFLDDKPIASLFPETTIIFADIAGRCCCCCCVSCL